MPNCIFEGSEKKAEIILSPHAEPLRNKPLSFWKKLCNKANTTIVSRFSSSFCDSYVLSESSLFVWDYRLLILTCGNSSLVKTILYILKKIKKSDREMLFYQRKNEFSPYTQKTSFTHDLQKINQKILGKAYCFGALDNHHFYLYCSTVQKHTPPKDRTIEILMYDLDEHIKDFFFKATLASDIKNQFALDKIFLNAQVDDYMFKPFGYSLNALIGKNKYYTIHVTPQDPGFYVSFETNVDRESVTSITQKILSIFKPHNFDIIVFSGVQDKNNIEFEYKSDYFIRSAYYTQIIDCGYKVSFSSFFTPIKRARQAYKVIT